MIVQIQKFQNNKYVLLSAMCLALALSMISFAIWPIFLVQFRDIWILNNTQIGWISGSYFIGYLLFTPIFVGLTDKIDSKWIFFCASITTIIGCLGLSFLTSGFWSACIFFSIIGAGLAGTYMPGLQVLNSRLDSEDRVKFTPWYTSFFGIGNGLSFAIIGFIFSNFNWEIACITSIISSVFACFIIVILINNKNPEKFNSNKRHFLDFRPAFKNQEALSYIFSYGVHTFELFAYRAWVFALMVWMVKRDNIILDTSILSSIISVIMFCGMVSSLIGAKLCLDFGRKKILIIIGLSTFIISIIGSVFISINFWFFIFIIATLNIFIMMDSGSLTAGTVSASKDNERGAILAVHTLSGFGFGAISGPILGYILDISGGSESTFSWSLALLAMGFGSLLVMIIQLTLNKNKT